MHHFENSDAKNTPAYQFSPAELSMLLLDADHEIRKQASVLEDKLAEEARLSQKTGNGASCGLLSETWMLRCSMVGKWGSDVHPISSWIPRNNSTNKKKPRSVCWFIV